MQSMRVWHLGLAVLGLAMVTSMAMSACSLALNWDQDGLPCEYDAASGKYSCLSGYTCALRDLNNPNENLCIKNHTLAPNANCQKDIQCVTGYTCPSGVCLPVCDPNTAYLSSSSCSLGDYCRPFYTTSGYTGRDTPTVALEGACVPSENCSVGGSCMPAGGTAGSGNCLAINASTSACVLHCDVAFVPPTNSSGYEEMCAPAGNYQSSCQAVGPTGGEVTACVTNFPTPLAPGAACNNAISQPCKSGYTCWAGQCAEWCPVTDSPSTGCGTAGTYCCPTPLTSQNGSVVLGYCVNGTEANCTAN